MHACKIYTEVSIGHSRCSNQIEKTIYCEYTWVADHRRRASYRDRRWQTDYEDADIVGGAPGRRQVDQQPAGGGKLPGGTGDRAAQRARDVHRFLVIHLVP